MYISMIGKIKLVGIMHFGGFISRFTFLMYVCEKAKNNWLLRKRDIIQQKLVEGTKYYSVSVFWVSAGIVFFPTENIK